MDIFRFFKVFFFNLYQIIVFGFIGFVIIDMLVKIQKENFYLLFIDFIFLDIFYYFKEIYEFVDIVKECYGFKMYVFKLFDVEIVEEFESIYGEKLYEMFLELYDWVVKVEF